MTKITGSTEKLVLDCAYLTILLFFGRSVKSTVCCRERSVLLSFLLALVGPWKVEEQVTEFLS